MAASVEVFDEMKRFYDFTDQDVANLGALAGAFAKHGGHITDSFYENLAKFPATLRLIEGRVDMLKATHGRWMNELFQGNYGEDYFNNRLRIGKAHVRIGLDPYYVEGVMSYLRSAGLMAIREEVSDGQRAAELTSSFLKILDIDLFIINLAYGEERLDRLAKFTGMSRKLLENCIRKST